MPLLYAASVLDGASQAFVWPALQAHIGTSQGGGTSSGTSGPSQSPGARKTVGFLVFGAIAFLLARSLEGGTAAGGGTSSPEAAYFPGILLGCGALAFALLFLFRPRSVRAPEEAAAEEEDHVAGERRGSGWPGGSPTSPASASGDPRLPLRRGAEGLGPPRLGGGAVVGTVYLAQTASFHLLGRWTGWHWRGGPLLGAAALGRRRSSRSSSGRRSRRRSRGGGARPRHGLCYMASIYYSVHAPEDRGARAGIHEAVVGAGTSRPLRSGPRRGGGRGTAAIGVAAPSWRSGRGSRPGGSPGREVPGLTRGRPSPSGREPVTASSRADRGGRSRSCGRRASGSSTSPRTRRRSGARVPGGRAREELPPPAGLPQAAPGARGVGGVEALLELADAHEAPSGADLADLPAGISTSAASQCGTKPTSTTGCSRSLP